MAGRAEFRRHGLVHGHPGEVLGIRDRAAHPGLHAPGQGQAPGGGQARRQGQSLAWMWQLIDSGLRQHFRQHPRVQENLPALTRSVEEGHTTPAAAAYALLDYLKH